MPHADESRIAWNGRELSVTVQTDLGPVPCIVPRETIRGLSVYNGALGWQKSFQRPGQAISRLRSLAAEGRRHLQPARPPGVSY
jgi:hypothetical protein